MRFKRYTQRNHLPKVEQVLLSKIEQDIGEPLAESMYWGFGYNAMFGRLTQIFLRSHYEDRKLTVLPDEVCAATELELLSIGINRVKKIPRDIGNLIKISSLFCGNNLITKVPESINQLLSLQTLELQNNRIKEFPGGCDRLISLRDLSLGNNLITSLPDDIGELPRLMSLRIPFNKIRKLPASTQDLIYLRRLHYGDNEVKELPEWIGNFKYMQELSLHDNQLETLPESFGELKYLQVLDLRNNKLEEIPINVLTELKSLQDIYISGNPLSEKFMFKFKMIRRLLSSDVRIDGQNIDDYFDKSDLFD